MPKDTLEDKSKLRYLDKISCIERNDPRAAEVCGGHTEAVPTSSCVTFSDFNNYILRTTQYWAFCV